MIQFDIIILLGLFYSILMVCIGYFCAPKCLGEDPDASKYMYYFPPGADIATTAPIVMRRPIKPTDGTSPYNPKPGGIFADIPSGPVQRPTAAQLKEWAKDSKKKGEEEAMSQTFLSDPILKEARMSIKRFADTTKDNGNS